MNNNMKEEMRQLQEELQTIKMSLSTQQNTEVSLALDLFILMEEFAL